jgi:hypothetical protein
LSLQAQAVERQVGCMRGHRQNHRLSMAREMRECRQQHSDTAAGTTTDRRHQPGSTIANDPSRNAIGTARIVSDDATYGTIMTL